MPNSLRFTAGDFEAKILQLDPADDSAAAKAHAIWKSHLLLGRLAAHKHYFTDYTRGCSGECAGFCRNAAPGCAMVKHRVAAALLAKDAICWEVWRSSVDFCGILRLSEVEPGCSAKAHYMFFDGKLKDKTSILQAWKEFAFSRLGLRRVTIEVPSNAFTLAKHAVKHLGFGGDYDYAGLPVEGVMKQARIFEGKPIDMLILGCVA